MDDLAREKRKGFSLWYLKDVILRRKLVRDTYHTPGFGLAAQLFAAMSRSVMEKHGPAEGEALIREAVEFFGQERGRSIARVVAGQGKPLSLKNWLIYSDIDGSNFEAKAAINNHDLVVKVYRCAFLEAADKWGLKDYAASYCKYADYAILHGYNPDVKLVLRSRHDTGKDHCLFRYTMKESNK